MKDEVDGMDEMDRREKRYRPLTILPVLVAAVAVASVLSSPVQRWLHPVKTVQQEFTGEAMGTTYTVKVLMPEPDVKDGHAKGVQLLIEAVLEKMDEDFSTYRPDSALARFNQSSSTDPVPVSAEMIDLFLKARRVSEASGGAFDVTVAPLVDAWGFGPEAPKAKPPTEEEIARLKERVGYRNMEVDAEKLTIRKTRPDVACDVGAIAPGYASDKIGTAIEDQFGYRNYMVELGGEVRAEGRNLEGIPWQIGIEKPDPENRAVDRIVGLSGESLSTSGDYRNYHEQDGVRLSHTIDPATGRPISHKLASVSVLHRECAMADGYATAIMVLGPERGYDLAVREGLPALLLTHNDEGGFTERTTPGFEKFVVP